MANRSAAAKKAWLSRQAGPNSTMASSLEQTMRAQRDAVIAKRVKGSDSARARRLAADMRASFKALHIQAQPWFRGLKALAHGKGQKNYDMERRTGLPRANTWQSLPRMSDTMRLRIMRLERKVRT